MRKYKHCCKITQMGNEITIHVPEAKDLGPAMRALNERQRAFVVGWFHTGSKTKAAAAAGYSEGTPGSSTLRSIAWHVAHSQKVREAIREYAAEAVLNGLVPKAMKVMDEVMEDMGHKDRLTAARMVLERTGFHAKSEQIVTKVEVNREERILSIIHKARALGMDPRKIIGGAVDFVDADYEIIEREEAKVNNHLIIDQPNNLEGLEDIV